MLLFVHNHIPYLSQHYHVHSRYKIFWFDKLHNILYYNFVLRVANVLHNYIVIYILYYFIIEWLPWQRLFRVLLGVILRRYSIIVLYHGVIVEYFFFFFHLKCVAYQLIIFVRQVAAIAYLFTRFQTSQHIECVVINRISWWRKTLLPSNIAKIQILQIYTCVSW